MRAPPRFDRPRATIDDVIRDLTALVEWSYESESRHGYFARVYLAVTREIGRAVEAGEFVDPDLVARLDVVFAGRYLDAVDAHYLGRPHSRAWRLALETDQRHALMVLQHVLLGINAHINLDLGIASATVAPGPAIERLRVDFDRVNEILGRLVDRVEGAIGRSAPLLALADRLAGGLDERMILFSVKAARRSAWECARELAATPPELQADRIADLDDVVVGFAELVAGNQLTRFLASPLTHLERRRPREVLDLLGDL
ncbi:MAG: DUF5995 family protein [Nannocystaceae bacterium]